MRRTATSFAALSLAFAALALSPSAAGASPVTFTFTDVIAGSTIAGVAAGQPAEIRVTLDNGNAGLVSQTWTAGDAVSITYDFNNGGLLTTFTAPFGGGFLVAAGVFATDAAGTLVDVMDNWSDATAADVTSNGGGSSFAWYLNGLNQVYEQNGRMAGQVQLDSPASMLDPVNWTVEVPEPASLAILSLGLLALGFSRRARPGLKAGD